MAWREKVSISDEEIGLYYDENLNTYRHPEERRASHVLFRVTPDMDEDQKNLVRKQAESVHARIAGGESMEPLAKAMSQDPGSARRGGDLGWFGRGDMETPFEQAAFDTPVGELAPVTETAYGFHVIQVTDSRTEGTTPLEEVRENIRNNLTIRKAHEQVNEEAARLRDAMADAETFTSVAGEEQLEILEMTVTREDRLPELAPTPDLMENLFELEPDMVAGPFTVSTGQALITLDEILPPSVAALDEVENEVRAAILDHRMTAAALEAGREALERRGSLAAAAEALDGEVQESVDLAPGRINLPGSGGHSPDLARVLFAEDTVEGAKGVTQVPAGAVVYQVTGRVPFDPEAFETARETLGREVLDAKRARMLDAILTRLWDRYTIEYNEPLIEQANS
jgi:parvulin-like peptidyl-prolyl isomerase